MVQLVEILAGIAEKRGLTELSEDLKKVVYDHRGNAPETLKGVVVFDGSLEEGTIFDHPKFLHYRDTRIVVPKNGDGIKKRLARNQDKLLTELEERPNILWPTNELAEKVLGVEYSKRTFAGVLGGLRQKVEADSKHPKIIVTVGNIGYVFKDVSREIREIQEEGTNGIVYYPKRYLVVVAGIETYLSQTENKLLYLLATNAGKIVAHSDFEELWKDNQNVDVLSALRCNIRRLRKKIEPGKKGKEFKVIRSVPREGYTLDDSTLVIDDLV
jgi:DNA-binding response OmpR family regulator